MILAGDIGGTKTVLTLVKRNENNSLDWQKEQTYASQDFANFDDILADFITPDIKVTAACFGVAGPVVNQRCQTTNLPWHLATPDLQVKLATRKVKLLNDLEAMALGMLHLPDTDLLELNPNALQQSGNIAVIAAGTGLGEALLYWDGNKHLPMATEGGHTDFAPQNAQQIALLNYMMVTFTDHVSCERLISGIGFSHLYDFLLADGFAPACSAIPSKSEGAVDRNALISELGVTGADPLCSEVVRLFVQLYGAEAGNLALKSLSIGGVYIGGGIAPKILPAITDGSFMKAFTAKGRFADLLGKMPVRVCLNPKAPLLGAAHYFD